MRNGAWVSRTAQCPFYRCEDSYSVFCEGFFSQQYIRNCFTLPSLRREYADRFCRDGWTRCCFADSAVRERAEAESVP